MCLLRWGALVPPFFGLSFKGNLKLESNHSVATHNLSSSSSCVWLSWALTVIFILYDSLNLNSGVPFTLVRSRARRSLKEGAFWPRSFLFMLVHSSPPYNLSFILESFIFYRAYNTEIASQWIPFGTTMTSSWSQF